jgi:hypothetical protein
MTRRLGNIIGRRIEEVHKPTWRIKEARIVDKKLPQEEDTELRTERIMSDCQRFLDLHRQKGKEWEKHPASWFNLCFLVIKTGHRYCRKLWQRNGCTNTTHRSLLYLCRALSWMTPPH